MAQNATIYKASLNIANISQHYYDDLKLTIARHPSETEERIMVRLLAYALHAAPGLQFTRGLSSTNEPDLWRKGPGGDIDLWIDVGLPDPDRIRRACSRAQSVFIYCYGGRTVQLWWQRSAAQLARFSNLTATALTPESSGAMAAMADRNMSLHCTVDDDVICLSNTGQTLYVKHQVLMSGPCQAPRKAN